MPYLQLVFAALFWGGTFVAGRQLAPVLDPYAAAFLRFALATLLLLGWVYARHRGLPRIRARQAAAIVVLGATGVFAYNLLFFSGLQSVEAGRAALIVALNPVVIAVASVALYRERLSRIQIAGIGLSLAGAVIVIGRGDLAGLLRGAVGRGELLLLGCVLSWVAYTLLGRRLLRHVTPLVAVAYASLAGTSMLALLVVARGGLEPALLSRVDVWLNVAYLAFFGTVLAFVWYYKGVHAAGAGRAAQFINLVPVSAVLFGVLLLDEALTAAVLIGGALVITGLWLTNRVARGA
jgi:drug/metabolite transporter (DMT)-like permease